jgi:predicted O-linked N-acetylglucosamine transferase (SPINDLY family)
MRLKQKLADVRLTSKLFDTRLYVKQIEAAYVAMHERWQSGHEPDHIFINDHSAT